MIWTVFVGLVTVGSGPIPKNQLSLVTAKNIQDVERGNNYSSDNCIFCCFLCYSNQNTHSPSSMRWIIATPLPFISYREVVVKPVHFPFIYHRFLPWHWVSNFKWGLRPEPQMRYHNQRPPCVCVCRFFNGALPSSPLLPPAIAQIRFPMEWFINNTTNTHK